MDANGQPIQIIALAGSPEQEQMGGSKMWQLVSNPGVEGGPAALRFQTNGDFVPVGQFHGP